MAFFAPQFQIVSDLHLATPVPKPENAYFKLGIRADNLLLLGDIGLITDKTSLIGCAGRWRRTEGAAFSLCRATISPTVAPTTKQSQSYVALNTKRPDGLVDASNVFAATDTMWTRMSLYWDAHYGQLSTRSKRSATGHSRDIGRSTKDNDPQRRILIATHHSPTIDPRATGLKHRESAVSSRL
ncbi:hypothetical protein C7974DRAFT_376180 [Boeremia exigua]|uniref:uncharacterized protein n=1 Tax=Boeremia exigua TaxID=749465 RepID=UPI001E8E6D1B|nr:uncharacterized protein C7974DRAFT_376180 [Boeremia exigua]KAH6629323.1 hypothetical protein C7974DRAFT_376180 [Boeremia exigua]